jgi:hypothetical protein
MQYNIVVSKGSQNRWFNFTVLFICLVLTISKTTWSQKGIKRNGIENFSARLIQNKILLSWKTENEKEVSHYVIEKSNDKLNSTDIILIFTSDDNYLNKSYKHKDTANQNKETSYYRLKIVGKNGMVQFSTWQLAETSTN